jgi:hypothetical protein
MWAFGLRTTFNSTAAGMEKRRKLLILSNTYDLSANRVSREIGSERVFRFNFDIWQDYQIDIGPNDFRIANPTGFSIARSDVAKAYWRHPISRFQLQGHQKTPGRFYERWLRRLAGRETYPPRIPAEERFVETEMEYVVGEIRSLLWRDKKLVLVEPASHGRLGKLVQMEIANRYFPVPAYRMSYQAVGFGGVQRQRVVKSLTSERFGSNSFLWTTKVDESDLDKTLPWFVQDLVDADHDVTVVHIRGRNFAFSLERAAFVQRSVDWRTDGDSVALWKPERIEEKLNDQINLFMTEVGLQYGRLDFLRKEEKLWFLEVNSNGEWGWLDPNGDNGVLKALVAELHPDTPVHPIRNWSSQTEPHPND